MLVIIVQRWPAYKRENQTVTVTLCHAELTVICRKQLNVNSQQYADLNKFLDMTSGTLAWCEETTKRIGSLKVTDELAAAGKEGSKLPTVMLADSSCTRRACRAAPRDGCRGEGERAQVRACT